MSKLAHLLLRLVDVYKFDPVAAEAGVEAGEDQKKEWMEEFPSHHQLLDRGDEIARQKLRNLLLDKSDVLRRELSVLRDLTYEENSADFDEEPGFQTDIDSEIASELGMDKDEFLRHLADYFQCLNDGSLAPEEFRHKFYSLQSFIDNTETESRRKRFVRPSLGIELVRSFLVSLDARVNALQQLEELDLSGIPPNLVGPFNEACHCYLAGYKTACALLCGVIVEDLVKSSLSRLGILKAGQTQADLLIKAFQKDLLDESEREMALKIYKLRNEAAHNLNKYDKRHADEWIECLGNTRHLVVKLSGKTERA